MGSDGIELLATLLTKSAFKFFHCRLRFFRRGFYVVPLRSRHSRVPQYLLDDRIIHTERIQITCKPAPKGVPTVPRDFGFRKSGDYFTAGYVH